MQTRNAPADYWSETHASPSPAASRVFSSTNWGRPGGSVSDYVAEVPWPAADDRVGAAVTDTTGVGSPTRVSGKGATHDASAN